MVLGVLMDAQPQSHAESPAAGVPKSGRKPRCTDVAARYDAGSVYLARQGQLVAFHFGTPAGSVVVTMSVADVLPVINRPSSSNGVPWGEPTAKVIAADAEVIPAKGAPPPAEGFVPNVVGRIPSRRTGLQPLFRAAWADLVARKYTSISSAAAAHGLSPSYFSCWVSRMHRREWAVLKVGGTLEVK